MRKSLLLLFITLLISSHLFCQNRGVIFQESFDSDAFPAGWSLFDDGASNWMISKSNNAGGEPNELQFGWTPPFEGITRIISCPIDLSGFNYATFSFKHYIDVFENSPSTIGIATSSDNGNSWSTVWAQSYDTDGAYVVDKVFNSPDLGKDNVLLCLFFNGNSYNINFWYFDDIVIESLNQNDINLISIDNHSYTLHGENEFSFTIQNMGEITVESFEASYTIDGETVTETFNTNLSPKERHSYTFETKKKLKLGNHNLKVDITTINGTEDQNVANNTAEKNIVAAMSLSQRTPLIEHFSSSTCGPCVSVNSVMKELTDNNIGKFTYVKYCMNWPNANGFANGDPYYNNEGGVRKVFYNVMAAPSLFLDGLIDETMVIEQEELDYNSNIPAIANIRGAFNVEGNTINITADFMSYIDLQNVKAFISINEKTTTENAATNGETEFHHIMMKMNDANGKEINIEAGKYQRLEFSYDMSTTNVEDINDLEVALWLQNTETKEILNSHFAYGYSNHVNPVQNLNIKEDNNNLVVSWDAPQNANPTGYNVYVNNVLAIENTSNLSYKHQLTENGLYVIEVVALYDEKTSVGIVEMTNAVLDINENNFETFNIYPNPAKEFVKVSTVNGQQSTVRIYNCLGMMVDEIEVNSNEIEINVSDYNSGIYFINVETENGSLIKKMIVE